MKKQRRNRCVLIGVVLLTMVTGCSSGESGKEPVKEKKTVFAMDTVMEVTAYGKHAGEAVSQAAAEINRLDDLLSTGDKNSEVYRLNQKGEGKITGDTAHLLERSLELYEDTGGVFDISIYPVMEIWGFTSGNYRVPKRQELEAGLKLVDSSRIAYDSQQRTVAFEQEGMQIDFGGIAKGYTSLRVMEIYRETGVESGMVNLGGNVCVLGGKPDGSRWEVAIQNPDKEKGVLGVLAVKDRAVVTSGGYERCFEEGGRTYHHIIDPKTGYPAESGLRSVTIVSKDGTLADGLSTSLFIMGKDQAAAYWSARRELFDAIFLTKEGKLYVTEGIAADFETQMQVQVLS